MIYILIYILYTTINILIKNKKINKKYFHLGLIPLLLLILFRGFVGTDSFSYHRIILAIVSSGWDSILTIEPFFFIYAKISYFIFENLFLCVNFLSFVIIIIFYKSLKNISGNSAFFFTTFCPIFIYNFSMNGLREGLACSLFVYSIDNLNKNKFWSFIIISLLSITSHYSILYVFIMYFIINKNFKLKISYLLIVLLLISIFIYTNFEILEVFLLNKYAEYSIMNTPSNFSGLSPLILLSMLSALILSLDKFSNNLKIILFYLFNLTIFLNTNLLGYAALRFMWLNTLIICLYLIVNFRSQLSYQF